MSKCNFDFIPQLSFDEMAKLLENAEIVCHSEEGRCGKYDGNCEPCVKDWLQQKPSENMMRLVKRSQSKQLIEQYPFLRPDDENYDYSWTKLNWLPKGWLIAFGSDLLLELRDILIKNNCLDSYSVIEIKEKFGTLRWYSCGYPKELRSEMQAFEDKYKVKSAFTCIECGKPATVVTTDYILPLCDECLKEEIKENPENSHYKPVNEWYKEWNEKTEG